MIRHLAGLLLTTSVVAQSTFAHYVLVEPAPGAPAEVHAVDPTSGAVQGVHTMGNGWEPLAIAHDPFDGDLFVALDDGAGQTRITRLHDVVGSWVPFPMGSVPRRAGDLAVCFGALFVAVEGQAGGLHRLPRRGGPATLEQSVPGLSAMMSFSPETSTLALARSGAPGTPTPFSGTAMYDVNLGYYPFPMTSFSDPLNRTIVGIVDLPTALPRQLLAFDDGSFALYTSFATPALTPLATSQTGNAALHPSGPYAVDAMVLGGSPPRLSVLDPWAATLTPVSVALPGRPVDFAPGLSRSAGALSFGASCGPVLLGISYAGAPQRGSSMSINLPSAPSMPLLLALGLDDFDGGALPAPLPGGCALEVRPDVVLLLPAGATWSLAIPANPTLVGTVVFSQLLLYDPAGMSTTQARAHRIGL